MIISMSFDIVSFPLAQVFRIARGAKTKADVVEVRLSANGKTGRGEAVPYNRYQESLNSVQQQLAYVQSKLQQGVAIEHILESMAPGAAKNAIDCGYWDLKAKLEQTTVESLLGLEATPACITAQTLSIDTPEAMAKAVKGLSHPPLVKVKLDNQDIVQKMRAIHQAAPFSKFIIDANEGWSMQDLTAVLNDLAKLNVVLIEQPLPAGQDEQLLGFKSPIPLCADESCHTRKDLPYLKSRYEVINVKLDKTGGLSEALALIKAAKAQGFSIMVGCMVGSSLAMAPAYLLTGFASYVDLDGPLLVAQDRPFGFTYDRGVMQGLDMRLWGGTVDSHY